MHWQALCRYGYGGLSFDLEIRAGRARIVVGRETRSLTLFGMTVEGAVQVTDGSAACVPAVRHSERLQERPHC